MAPRCKKAKQIVSDKDPSIRPAKKAKKLIPTAKMSANSTTVVTKILLDDANNGYEIGNFVFSPLSLDIVLGMLAAIAKGKTLKQLLAFLGHKSIDAFLARSPSSKLFKQILSNPKNGLDFSLVNGVWVDEKVAPVQSSYQEVLETVYRTEAKCVDFGIKLDDAVEEINSWVHKETNGLIPSIVERNDFNEKSVMVIANALYFKGSWSNSFDAYKTKDKDFSLINGQKVSVPFMTTSYKKFDYGSEKDYKMIKIPFESKGALNKFSMYIFIPNQKDGLKNLLQLFHSKDALFHGEFNLERVLLDELWIPKFKMSSKFEPKDVMKQMGLTLPFEETNKELSGIIEPRRLFDNMLYVSKIIQKSFFEVDERGTEAAACTVAHVRKVTCARKYYTPPPPRPSFVADHPFIFMIREDSSQAVLFVGVVLNPLVNN